MHATYFDLRRQRRGILSNKGNLCPALCSARSPGWFTDTSQTPSQVMGMVNSVTDREIETSKRLEALVCQWLHTTYTAPKLKLLATTSSVHRAHHCIVEFPRESFAQQILQSFLCAEPHHLFAWLLKLTRAPIKGGTHTQNSKFACNLA